MKLTRSNVAHDLHYSPHRYTLDYDGELIEFVFSSAFNMNRFIERLEENRDVISVSLSKRFGFTITNHVLSDLRLYTSIEKRGFLVETNKDVFECPDTIRLNGINKIMKK